MKNYYFDITHPLRPFTIEMEANNGSHSPINALRKKPNFKDGYHPCEKDGDWFLVVDMRGLKAYKKSDASEVEIKELGKISEELTLLNPECEYPSWDGEKWVTDEGKKKEHLISLATVEKEFRLSEVSQITSNWQTQLMLGIINDEDKLSLTKWMKYLQRLQSIDVTNLPVKFPEKPE